MCHSPAQICSSSAFCTDLPPPSLDVLCKCREGFYGDGLVSIQRNYDVLCYKGKYVLFFSFRRGSGCQSLTTLLLAILLPTIFVLIVTLLIAVFLIRKRSQARKNEQLQRFITDLYAEDGILTYYQDPDAISVSLLRIRPVCMKVTSTDHVRKEERIDRASLRLRE